MFLIKDTLSTRQEKIKSFEPFVAIILAAADFEWTVRRGILALGKSPTKLIRQDVLKGCHGLNRYKEAWRKEVTPYTGDRLTDVIHDWQFFKEKAYPLRHQLIHGVSGSLSPNYAQERIDSILTASRAITEYAISKGEPIYGRKIVRRKHR